MKLCAALWEDSIDLSVATCLAHIRRAKRNTRREEHATSKAQAIASTNVNANFSPSTNTNANANANATSAATHDAKEVKEVVDMRDGLDHVPNTQLSSNGLHSYNLPKLGADEQLNARQASTVGVPCPVDGGERLQPQDPAAFRASAMQESFIGPVGHIEQHPAFGVGQVGPGLAYRPFIMGANEPSGTMLMLQQQYPQHFDMVEPYMQPQVPRFPEAVSYPGCNRPPKPAFKCGLTHVAIALHIQTAQQKAGYAVTFRPSRNPIGLLPS